MAHDDYAAWLDDALGSTVRYHIELDPSVAKAYVGAFHADPVALEWLARAAGAGSGETGTAAVGAAGRTISADPEQAPPDGAAADSPATPLAEMSVQLEEIDALLEELLDVE